MNPLGIGTIGFREPQQESVHNKDDTVKNLGVQWVLAHLVMLIRNLRWGPQRGEVVWGFWGFLRAVVMACSFCGSPNGGRGVFLPMKQPIFMTTVGT